MKSTMESHRFPFLTRTPDLGYDFDTNSGRAFNYFTYGVASSEVEIDCLTGAHKVIKMFDVTPEVTLRYKERIKDNGQHQAPFY